MTCRQFWMENWEKQHILENSHTGLHYKVVPRLRECCRQVEADMVSNTRNNIHQTWERPYSGALYILWSGWSLCILRRLCRGGGRRGGQCGTPMISRCCHPQEDPTCRTEMQVKWSVQAWLAIVTPSGWGKVSLCDVCSCHPKQMQFINKCTIWDKAKVLM